MESKDIVVRTIPTRLFKLLKIIEHTKQNAAPLRHDSRLMFFTRYTTIHYPLYLSPLSAETIVLKGVNLTTVTYPFAAFSLNTLII